MTDEPKEAEKQEPEAEGQKIEAQQVAAMPVAASSTDWFGQLMFHADRLPPEKLKMFMDLRREYEKDEARKAFDEAMAQASMEFPVIIKNRTVGFESRKPGASRTDYKYADLSQIESRIRPILGKYGLNYRFRTNNTDPTKPVTVTCHLSHRLGHAEDNSLSGMPETSGNKNPIQAIGSAVTFLSRYTLMAACGLSAAQDDDGALAGADTALITDEQSDRINKAIVATGSILDKFLRYYDVPSTADIPAKRFEEIMGRLEQIAQERGVQL